MVATMASKTMVNKDTAIKGTANRAIFSKDMVSPTVSMRISSGVPATNAKRIAKGKADRSNNAASKALRSPRKANP